MKNLLGNKCSTKEQSGGTEESLGLVSRRTVLAGVGAGLAAIALPVKASESKSTPESAVSSASERGQHQPWTLPIAF